MNNKGKLIIIKENNKYVVYHDYCVDNPFKFSKYNIIATETSLKDVIIFANKYCNKHNIDAGYEFIGVGV